ncbi:MAG: hypothetical protein LBI29_04240 [Rickettsiales bacterium]|nr:hypothetical protein [Rickettsiales bacterium]
MMYRLGDHFIKSNMDCFGWDWLILPKSSLCIVFFLSKLTSLDNWPDRPTAKFKEDFGDDI